VLKSHVVLWLKANTGTEDVGQSASLLSKSVDDWCSRRGQGSLKHVAENAEHAMEVLEVLGSGTIVGMRLPLDTSHHLGDENKINNQWGSKQRVLADIEKAEIVSGELYYYSLKNLRDSLVTSHEDLSIVLIQSTFVVTNSWHVLDHDSVVWVLALLVEDTVGFDHVIDDVGLGNLLGAELLLGAEVLSVVVAKVVVAGNGGDLDPSTNQEVDEGRLHLGLARLEVITSDECVVLLGKLNGAWNKGILWGAVDEWNAFKNRGNSEDSGWSNLLVTIFDGLHQVLSSIVDTSDEVSKALGVGSPLNNDLLQSIVGLEVTD
jgi:hypothetical protein